MPDARFCRRCGTKVGSRGRMCECGNVLLPDARFCRKCGVEVTEQRVCDCGNVLPHDAVFCWHCGAKWGSVKHSFSEAGYFSVLSVWRRRSFPKESLTVGAAEEKKVRIKRAVSSSFLETGRKGLDPPCCLLSNSYYLQSL